MCEVVFKSRYSFLYNFGKKIFDISGVVILLVLLLGLVIIIIKLILLRNYLLKFFERALTLWQHSSMYDFVYRHFERFMADDLLYGRSEPVGPVGWQHGARHIDALIA